MVWSGSLSDSRPIFITVRCDTACGRTYHSACRTRPGRFDPGRGSGGRAPEISGSMGPKPLRGRHDCCGAGRFRPLDSPSPSLKEVPDPIRFASHRSGARCLRACVAAVLEDEEGAVRATWWCLVSDTGSGAISWRTDRLVKVQRRDGTRATIGWFLPQPCCNVHGLSRNADPGDGIVRITGDQGAAATGSGSNGTNELGFWQSRRQARRFRKRPQASRSGAWHQGRSHAVGTGFRRECGLAERVQLCNLRRLHHSPRRYRIDIVLVRENLEGCIRVWTFAGRSTTGRGRVQRSSPAERADHRLL
jgi:hypothetical protein